MVAPSCTEARLQAQIESARWFKVNFSFFYKIFTSVFVVPVDKSEKLGPGTCSIDMAMPARFVTINFTY